MAGRWSWSMDACEFKDLQASAMAVDCIGNWCLLAGRKNLAFVNLNNPSPSIKVTRQSKWDIGCVQWNMHASCAYRFVTACNQRLDVFDFRDATASHLCSMKAHSRTVSDIDWSPFDVNVVASCSVDTFIYFWDVRDPKKPVKHFQTVTGAYQVKWNKVTNNLFATTHDGDVRIWDPRKGNTPIQYIAAHPSKIHGLDWSNTDQNKLVTASQDCTIRLWDCTSAQRSEALFNSGNPVWRARYTPFGEGVVSVVVPQLRRGENSLYLWHPSNQQVPVHTFMGHKDVIQEFQWRKQQEGVVDHHLVTWSKDQTLRIWKVDPALQKSCGHHIDPSTVELPGEGQGYGGRIQSVTSVKDTFSQNYKKPLAENGQENAQQIGGQETSNTGGADREGAGLLSHQFSGLSTSSSLLHSGAMLGPGGPAFSPSDRYQAGRAGRAATPGVGAGALAGSPQGGNVPPSLSSMMSVVSLEQEMDEVQRSRIPGVRLDPPDFAKRTCVFKLTKGSLHIEVQLAFPDNYPVKISPKLAVLSSNLDSEIEARLLRAYNDSCSRHVKQHVNCVEPCLRQMLQAMEKTSSSSPLELAQEERKMMVDKKFVVEKVSSAPSAGVIPMYPTGSFQDSCIPFPRTCGARFCSNDYLVTFGVPVSMKKVHEENEVTPRALSDLITYVMAQHPWVRNQSNSFAPMGLFYGSSPHSTTEEVSISSFFVEKTSKPRHQRHHSQAHYKSHYRPRDSIDASKRASIGGDRDIERSSRRQQKVGAIKIYDITCINPVSRSLAEKYKLDLNDIQGTCEHNAAVAKEINRMDLAQVWRIVLHMSHRCVHPLPHADSSAPFAHTPFGRPLLKRMLEHYGRMRDIQTMAMLCCIFWDRHPSPGQRERDPLALQAGPGSSAGSAGVGAGVAYMSRNHSRTSLEYTAAAANQYNPYHTVSSMTGLLKGWTSTAGPAKSPTDGSTHTSSQPGLSVSASTTSSALMSSSTSIGGNIRSRLSSPVRSPQMAGRQSHATLYQSSNSVQNQQQQPQPTQVNRALSAGASIKAMFLPLALSNIGVPPPAPPPPPPPTPSSPNPSHTAPFTSPLSGSGVKAKGFSRVKGEMVMGEVASQPNLAAAFRAAVMKSKRSSSWSESFDDFKILEDKDPRQREAERERMLHHKNSKMLDPDQWYQYEQIKHSYADLLFKWGLLNQRRQVLKRTVAAEADVKSIELNVTCWNCMREVRGVQCTECSYPALQCSICHIGVRGAANMCIACGHGGHLAHLMEWFETYNVCPTGCGCHCLEENIV